jgi:hypothetical protein
MGLYNLKNKSMPFYTGKSADGSDIKEVEGMYVSACGNYWSSKPFKDKASREIYKRQRAWNEIMEHINGKRTIREEYSLIKEKKSTLSARCKKLIIECIEKEAQ